MSTHALLSPSSAYRWLACPSSVVLSKDIPDHASSFAREGTAAHQLAQWALEAGHDTAAYLGRLIEVEGEHFAVDDEMAGHVQEYIDLVRFMSSGEGDVLMVEQRLAISHLTGEDQAGGTSDAVILKGKDYELQVHDLKYGRGHQVHAEHNEQLMIYAKAAVDTFGLLGEIRQVRMVIHQPRLGHVSEWSCSVEYLDAWATTVRQRADLCFGLFAQPELVAEHLNPGDKQCLFCKAKATCPALRAVIDEVTDAVPIEADPLASAMAKVDLVEGWAKAVRAEVERRLLDGHEVPGFKLVQGKRGNRAWSSEAAAESLLKSFRLKQDQMYVSKLITPTAAEKLLAKENPVRWNKVRELITQSEGSPSVAPVTDKRPALEISQPQPITETA